LKDPAVANYREYLKIKTVHPKPDYETAAVWLKKQAEEIGLEVSEKEVISDISE
jgi:aminoacylase